MRGIYMKWQKQFGWTVRWFSTDVGHHDKYEFQPKKNQNQDLPFKKARG